MKNENFSIRIWALAGAVVTTVVATDVFGFEGGNSCFREACEERFDAWYGDMEKQGSEDVVEEYVADFEFLEEQLTIMDVVTEERDTLPIHNWVVKSNDRRKAQRISEQRLRLDGNTAIVPIEVYDGDTTAYRFNRFVDKLIWGDEVRIAVLGDSFIEGDILTSDLREALQATFGGRGVGFVQCDIPFSTARRTIKRTVSGWSAYSVLKPKKNPADINETFFVSGYTARGTSGAKVSWQTTKSFERLDSCSQARILLTTPDSCSVLVTLNQDTTLRRQFDIVNVDLPQQILIEGDVNRLDMEVLAGTVDCYGASIEGVGGVVVDNLSMRANSGHAIFGTSAIVNRQIDTYMGYDLVVLQYGLNIMEAGRSNYAGYRTKLEEMIAYANSCFPDAAVLVLGVSDRWVKNEESGVYEPIGTVEALTSYQRAAAKASGASFWATADAMLLYGGMPHFVESGWAAKDYTHINFAGGKRLGEQLYRSIVHYAHERLKSGRSTSPIATTTAPKRETGSAPINSDRSSVASQHTSQETGGVDTSVSGDVQSGEERVEQTTHAETDAPATDDVEQTVTEAPESDMVINSDATVAGDTNDEGELHEKRDGGEHTESIVDTADIDEFFEMTL